MPSRSPRAWAAGQWKRDLHTDRVLREKRCRFALDPFHTCLDAFGQPVAGTDKVCADHARAELVEQARVLRETEQAVEG